MITVYKNGVSREIRDMQLKMYTDAGWSETNAPKAVVEAEEVINLKPPAKVKAAVKSADDNNAIKQGE